MAITVSMQPLSLSLSAKQATINTAIPMQPLSLSASASRLGVASGAPVLPMQPLSLSLSAGQVVVGIAVSMQPLSLSASANQLSVVPGAPTLSMQPLSLSLSARQVGAPVDDFMALTRLATFRQMEDAVVHSATSEKSAHLSDNLILLEPNFYWESDQPQCQHEVVIDLGKPMESNIVVLATRNAESAGSTPNGVKLTVSFSNDGDSFTPVSNPTYPGVMEGRVIKPFRFSLTGRQRYWKFVVSGYGPPSHWPPDPTRIAGIWVGREREIGASHAWPVGDSEVHPFDSLKMPFGMRFDVGRNLRTHGTFSRKYLLTDSDYDGFNDSLRDSGMGTPIVLQEGNGNPMLVRIVGDIDTETLYNGMHVVSIQYVELPLLPAGETY